MSRDADETFEEKRLVDTAKKLGFGVDFVEVGTDFHDYYAFDLELTRGGYKINIAAEWNNYYWDGYVILKSKIGEKQTKNIKASIDGFPAEDLVWSILNGIVRSERVTLSLAFVDPR